MILPAKAFFRPGETAEFSVPGNFHATIWHMGEPIGEVTGRDTLCWQPPPVPRRGYKVRAQTASGEYWTAFDVLEQWTDAPRYGYLFDFRPDRANYGLDPLLALHINGLQFYDWLYRHDTLLPPADDFNDPLGRPQSLSTVRRLIDEAHRRGMAAMPYTAIYAASPAFAAAHPGWGLYDAAGNLFDFASGFLKIMNPASGWSAHLAEQCAGLLTALAFDGIHLDQYGEPQAGFNSTGQPVNLPFALRGAIEQARTATPAGKTVLFNLVHNWPLDAVATPPLDFLYCELWPPMTTLGDLARVASENRAASGGRIPVVAVYVDPAHKTTVAMVQAVLLASGASHIAHGEDGLYLSDPYFPKAQRPSPELADHLQRLADFAVAYGELLGLTDEADVEAQSSAPFWMIARRAGKRLALHLLNATPDECWDVDLPNRKPFNDIRLSLKVDGLVARIWCDSPDADAAPQKLSFTQDGQRVLTVVPQVKSWTMVCVELG